MTRIGTGRLAVFAALATLGCLRWGVMIVGVPAGRLLAPVAIGLALAAGLPPLRRAGRLAAPAATFLALLVAIPLAGVPLRWCAELRVALIWRLLRHGVDAIPGALVPVLGGERPLRSVILLGAGWLTILGGLLVGLGSGRADTRRLRAAAMLPLLVLVAVPGILVPPRWPYLEGLAVFALLVAGVWTEPLLRPRAVSLLAAAGLTAALLAPGVHAARPWIDVRHLAGSLGNTGAVRFDFRQGFGPLNWSRTGRVMFEVRARHPEYWKAVDLDRFDGRGFMPADAPRMPLPAPSGSAGRDAQTITVTIRGLQTPEVIAAGTTQVVWRMPGDVEPALSPGTFTVDPPPQAGVSYDAATLSPHPAPSVLERVRGEPALPALDPYLSIYQPAAGATEVIQFPSFHTGTTGALAGTPYAGVYALAQRLARAAPTPAALVAGVMGLLSRGFVYDERPPAAPYPLASFLLATHRGYCQQFAGAMALLLRMGGVPARVVGGFTTGTYDPGTNRWVVQDVDAHDWVEAWFPGIGWVTFDPTPAVDPARTRSAALPSSLPAATTGAGARPAAPTRLRHRDTTTPAGAATRPLRGGRAPAPGGTPLLGWVAVLALLVPAAAAAMLIRRRRAPEDQATVLVRELERALTRSGRPLAGGVTLSALEHRFSGRDGAVRYIRALREARYAGRPLRLHAGDRRALRRALGEGTGPVGRLRAWWSLPPRGGAGAGLH